MSADNGYVIRPDGNGKWVLQHYLASADSYPDIREDDERYTSIVNAVAAYTQLAPETEYGLTLNLSTPEELNSEP